MARPLLLIDVDGVLLPFPDRRPGFDGVAVEGAPHGFCADHGDWLRELAADYAACWGTVGGGGAHLRAVLVHDVGGARQPRHLPPAGDATAAGDRSLGRGARSRPLEA